MAFCLLLAGLFTTSFFAIPAQAQGDNESTDLPKRIQAVVEPPDQNALIPESEGGVLFDGVTEACWYAGTCNLCDILAVVVNVSNIILRTFAILGVIFLLYGAGFIMMSSGNSDRLKKGKDAMQAAIIGGILVLAAWQIMAFVGYLLLWGQVGRSDNTSLPYNPITSWFSIVDVCRQSVDSGQSGNFLPYDTSGPEANPNDPSTFDD